MAALCGEEMVKDKYEVEEEVMETEDSMMEDSVLEEDERDSFLKPSSKSRFTLRKRKRRIVLKEEVVEVPDDTYGCDNISICLAWT